MPDTPTIGGPEGIRTLGRPVKSRTLYLAKLQALLCTADTLERLAKQEDYIIISDFQGSTRALDDRDGHFVTLEVVSGWASVAVIIKPRAIAARGVCYGSGA